MEQKKLKNDLQVISESCKDTDAYLSSLAKSDVNIGLEYFIKDADGKRVIQAALHKEIQFHIEECKRRNERYCGILAPWGHGKCFAKGTLINTVAGEEIKIENFNNNLIYDQNGKKSSPLWFGKIGKKECNRLNFSSSRSQTVTHDHPYLTSRGWVKANDIIVGDLIKLSPPKDFNKISINNKNSWLAGLYIGDGSYGKISCNDNAILEYLKEFGTLTYLEKYDYYLRGIGKVLRSLGINDRKAKVLPNIRKWDLDSIRHFLAGWFDADGTINFCAKYRIKKDGSKYQKARRYIVELYSINKWWLQEAQYALLRLGIPCKILIKKGKYLGKVHISWRLIISGKPAIRKFRDVVPMLSSKSLRLYDKAIDNTKPIEDLWDYVKSNDNIGKKECYGFTMPNGFHSINGLVSHNTEQVVIGRALHYLGENHNYRIFIVCNTDDNAMSRVSSISKYILEDKDYNKLYPNVRPAKLGDWTKHKLIVERDSKSKDGSIEAWGVTTSGTGSRCDILLVDDPVDLRNAVLNPALREQVKSSFKNVWLSRLSPEGICIYIATIWHQDDLTSEMLVNPQWKFLTMKISEDFESVECDSAFKGKFNIPLWESYWNKKALLSRLGVIGKRAFNRGFRQQALSDEDKTFPSSEIIFKENVNISDVVQPQWPKVMGIDPFGQWVVLFTIAYNPHNYHRYPIEIVRKKFGPKETVIELLRQFDKHNHEVIVCENNAAQDAILQWAKEKGRHDMPIIPFTTGKQKADPALGLPSIEVEFANGAWTACMGSKHESDCKCGFCVWRNELYNHPLAKTYDCVMASWFAREGIRYLAKKIAVEQAEAQVPETIDAEDLGVEPVVIGGHY